MQNFDVIDDVLNVQLKDFDVIDNDLDVKLKDFEVMEGVLLILTSYNVIFLLN